MSVYAYGEAVRQLEQALEVQDVLDPDGDGTTLRSAAGAGRGDAARPINLGASPRPWRRRRLRWRRLARTRRAPRGPPSRRLMRLWRAGPAMAEFAEWAARADRHAADGSVERVYADSYLGVSRLRDGPAG